MMSTRTRRPREFLTAGLILLALAGCTHTVKVEPIKVEPIDITLHIYLEADQKLDSFFGDDTPASPAPSSRGSSSPAPVSSAEPTLSEGASS